MEEEVPISHSFSRPSEHTCYILHSKSSEERKEGTRWPPQVLSRSILPATIVLQAALRHHEAHAGQGVGVDGPLSGSVLGSRRSGSGVEGSRSGSVDGSREGLGTFGGCFGRVGVRFGVRLGLRRRGPGVRFGSGVRFGVGFDGRREDTRVIIAAVDGCRRRSVASCIEPVQPRKLRVGCRYRYSTLVGGPGPGTRFTCKIHLLERWDDRGGQLGGV